MEVPVSIIDQKYITNNSLLVLVTPLNNIISFDNKFSDPDLHVENFLKIISEFQDLNNELSTLSAWSNNTKANFLKFNEVLNFREYMSTRIQLIPYVKNEFIKRLREENIKINLVCKKAEEIPIIEYELDLLGLNSYFDLNDDVVLFDNLCVTANDSSNSNLILFIGEKLEEIYYFCKKNKNCLSVFNFLIFNDTEEYVKLQEQNILFLQEHAQQFGFYPDLIVESLRQCNYLIEFAERYTKQSKSISMIRKDFTENSISIVYIFDSKSSAKNYRKRELATSTDKVRYIPFMNKNYGLEKSLGIYKNFQVFLQRCPYLYTTNKLFCDNLQIILNDFHKDKLILHDMNIIDICFKRINVYEFIIDFVNREKTEFKNKYSINLEVPFSFNFSINSTDKVDDIKETILNLIKFNSINIDFPLIIKPDSCTDHEMFLILNENGLNSFINEETLNKRLLMKNFICQKFISHGGQMFKTYYINNKSFTIIRPSLPDLEGHNLKIKNFENGCFNFYNEFLYKKEDPKFWEQIQYTSSPEKMINYDALIDISIRFAEIKNITLFGLDYLYDEKTNTYYLLEVNYFPSYRELGSSLITEFAEHFILYYNKFSSKNK